MSIELIRWDPRRDGPLSEQAMSDRLRAMGYTVNRYTYPAGTRFPPHSHVVDKIDAILEGRFRMEMAGQSVVLGAGDCIVVPAGVVHSAEVVGQAPVISLDAVKLR